jgi:hypothetical protein
MCTRYGYFAIMRAALDARSVGYKSMSDSLDQGIIRQIIGLLRLITVRIGQALYPRLTALRAGMFVPGDWTDAP